MTAGAWASCGTSSRNWVRSGISSRIHRSPQNRSNARSIIRLLNTRLIFVSPTVPTSSSSRAKACSGLAAATSPPSRTSKPPSSAILSTIRPVCACGSKSCIEGFRILVRPLTDDASGIPASGGERCAAAKSLRSGKSPESLKDARSLHRSMDNELSDCADDDAECMTAIVVAAR